ncbi:ISL3 family transposase [Haploplasma axanthum]|uniref:Transposase and inactivated derivatives n=9 Tax=Haploplasma axanthum TaxID=29552 RepID=A0A449BC83_HAPAX|nr:ISL3 family transposase [Haploplasma axanthum]VEU80054.1 Transposase and inactivated derivatives [Haploplasma axanthum]VEU80753.1 Transposase and inactivated derivatives [Haploplasma axanthum]
MYDNIIKVLEIEHLSHKIESIDAVSTDGIVSFHIKLKKETIPCPLCNGITTTHDYQNKNITHSISTNRKSYIIYRSRRYRCLICKKRFFESNPFTIKKDRISHYTKLSILEHLKNPSNTFTSASTIFNVSTKTVIDIFDDYVDPNRNILPKFLCIDEFHVSKRTKHPYACLFLDFETKKIIDVLKTRHKSYLLEYLSSLKHTELDSVKVVIIDMWKPYKDVISKVMPKALIAIDSFHVIKHINDIVNKHRIKVMNKYAGNIEFKTYKNDKYYMLKKFHYFFTKEYDNIYNGYISIPKFRISLNKSSIKDFLLSIDDDLTEVYKIKEEYREFNRNTNFDDAKELLSDLITKYRNHRLEDIRSFGKLLSNWKDEIINSFIKSDSNRRLSNGPIEGTNSRIKTIIKTSNGIKSFKRLRARIIYSINKDVALKIPE